ESPERVCVPAASFAARLGQNDMIFGRGDVILEYWAALETYVALRAKVAAFSGAAPAQGADALLAAAKEVARLDLYGHFVERYRHHDANGGQECLQRSNQLIAFSQADDLRIGGDYRLASLQLDAKFANRAPEKRFAFFQRFRAFDGGRY